MLRAGDISLNPGTENNQSKTTSCPRPTRKHIAPRYFKCEKPVARNRKRLERETCHSLTHIQCANTNSICIKNMKANQLGSWTCSNRFLSELPFESVKDLNSIDESCESLVDTCSNAPCLYAQALRANPSHLSMMHLNTQSMTSTFDELSLLISDCPFDIVTLSETWLENNQLLLNYVSIPGYATTCRNWNVCKGGRVGAHIKESVQFKRRTDIENLETEFEHLWREFPGKNKNSKLLIGTIYRSELILDTKVWLDMFDDLLSTVMTSWDGLPPVTGDINICLLDSKPNMSNIERQYRDLLESLNLTQHITRPTTVTRTTKSLIDYVISDDPSRVVDTDVLPAPSVSDHGAVYAIINARVTRYAPRHKYIRNEKQFDMQAFRQDFLCL